MQFCDKSPHSRAPLNNRANKCDYFRLLFGTAMVENLVEHTNLYTLQPKVKAVRSRGCHTHEIVANSKLDSCYYSEIDAFIGMCILMAVHHLPEIKHYWSSDPLLSVLAVSQVMTINRFKKVIETIHVNDN